MDSEEKPAQGRGEQPEPHGEEKTEGPATSVTRGAGSGCLRKGLHWDVSPRMSHDPSPAPCLLFTCGINNFMMPLKRNKSPRVLLGVLKVIFRALDPEDHKVSSGVPIKDAARYLRTWT